MKPIARSIAAMERSGIRVIRDLAETQPDVIRLQIGEPDFPTPEHIVAAAARAGAEGYTKYTDNRGLAEVRRAMAAKIASRNGFDVGIDEIIITTGAVNGIVQALMVLCNPGDPVLIPDPAWPNYQMMTKVIGSPGIRYPLLKHEDFRPDLDALDKICTSNPGAKAIIINTPANPTGAVLSRDDLTAMLDIAARHDLYVISDECYDDIVFEGEHVSAASIDAGGRVITTFSVSKSYAMTGWRVGYAVAAPDLVPMIAKVQEAITSCATAVAQKAAQAALEGDQSCVAEMRDAYRVRRDRVVEILEDAGMLVSIPRGAFYIMADTSATGMEGYDLCRRLVLESGVAVAPGETFGPGGAGTVRISLASSIDDLVEGTQRLTAAVRAWS